MNDYVNKILEKGGASKIGNALIDFKVTGDKVEMFNRDTKVTNDFTLFTTTFCHSTFDNRVRKIVGYTVDDSVHELYSQWRRDDLYLNTLVEGGESFHAPRFDEEGNEVVDWMEHRGLSQEQLLDTPFVKNLFAVYSTILITFCDDVFPDGSCDRFFESGVAPQPRFFESGVAPTGSTWAQTYSIVRNDAEGAPPAAFYLDTSMNCVFEKTFDNVHDALQSGCLSAVAGFGN